jgi:hypothetical protein
MTIFETHAEAIHARHIYGETFFRCAKCHDVKPTPNTPEHIGSGYAVSDGKMICYNCADDMSREYLKTDTRLFAYVSADWKHLTTWSGGILGRIEKVGELHVWSRERRYITAVDVHGAQWYGVGSNGMYAQVRKKK